MKDSSLRQRVCRACGRSFLGGPRAWYCPQCRLERRKKQTAAYKARKRAGDVRELGSTDSCAICGAPYTVTGPNQRYCPACAPDAVKAVDSAQGMAYYVEHKDAINPLRNAKRRKGERICPICGAEYQAYGKNSYCSEACRHEGRRLSLVKSEARRKERRMQDKAKKDPRGGARPGAGRKKGGENSTREDAINRSVTLAAVEWEELGQEAKRYGISPNKLAAKIIRTHLAARPSPDTE